MKFKFLVLLFSLGIGNPGNAQNLEKGKEINSTCAGCHGELGQGGSRGEYPRLAGQQVKYLESQLKAFRARTRVNIPMYPYTQERELPDEDIKDVAAYLASIELPTKWPVFKDSDDALTRLTLTERVMIIPRAPGNLANGEAIYQKKCVTCHGKTGMGRGMFPMLVGQYTSYLMRQMEKYIKGERPHDEEAVGGLLNTLKEEDLQDILAYVTSMQERQ
ncbi:c-type cytochrome [Sulfuritalea hydrogenivorans]|uniref:Cytochrome c, class I n=1 Tax=Sulfuritalea hydrogenivorans sk43H TaxID=1223802 RepID=W0SGF1_9PROT|nr:c-type cytochrome [Sulfuritalea hydrogenivorans]MDK9715414.1 cytochrome c4 [Sulfuritalea sp.]BAO30359.1 cytochrome c, class I [Sulfuritalea hydrogenivorans sk43H]